LQRQERKPDTRGPLRAARRALPAWHLRRGAEVTSRAPSRSSLLVRSGITAGGSNHLWWFSLVVQTTGRLRAPHCCAGRASGAAAAGGGGGGRGRAGADRGWGRRSTPHACRCPRPCPKPAYVQRPRLALQLPSPQLPPPPYVPVPLRARPHRSWRWPRCWRPTTPRRRPRAAPWPAARGAWCGASRRRARRRCSAGAAARPTASR
jgi:hypothetical protein